MLGKYRNMVNHAEKHKTVFFYFIPRWTNKNSVNDPICIFHFPNLQKEKKNHDR